MKTIDDYRKSYPHKTDEQIMQSVIWELGQKVETISELLTEIENLKSSSQSGWTDEDMRDVIGTLLCPTCREPLNGKHLSVCSDAIHKWFEQKLQSLPKNPSLEIEAVLFAEFLAKAGYSLHSDMDGFKATWYNPAKFTGEEYFTTTELYNSPEYQKWKEGRK